MTYLPKAQLKGVLRAIGRTQDVMVCVCGHRNYIYRWSWAGHGKARCAGCKKWIDYRTHEVSA